jgi:hypothetical protein
MPSPPRLGEPIRSPRRSQRRRVVILGAVRRQDPLDHDGHDGQHGGSVRFDRGQRCIDVEATDEHGGRCGGSGDRELRQPPRVEQRCRDHGDVTRLIRDSIEHSDRRREPGRSAAAPGPLRCAGRARRQQHRRDGLARQERARRADVADVVDRSVRELAEGRVACTDCDHVAVELGAVDDREQFVVAHDRPDALAAQHLAELR